MEKSMFTSAELKKLIYPLIIEQILAITVGMVDTVMISYAGEAAMSGVSLVDMINNLLIEVLSTMAEQERVNIKQRQAEGIAIAKEKGKYKGRKKIEVDDNFKSVYKSWKAGEITATKAMELTGLKRNTFYRRVSEYEEN